METPRVGDEYSFAPSHEFVCADPDLGHRRTKKQKNTVTGQIISVNYPHRHFTVEYEINGIRQRETFKF